MTEDLDMAVRSVTTVKSERTFWDKIIILHGLRQWHDRRKLLRQGGQRDSRHYYDVYRLLQHPDAAARMINRDLAQDCAQHARLFFGGADLRLDVAAHGLFTLMPSDAMLDALTRDYEAMDGMIFRLLPPIDDVLQVIADLEQRLNMHPA